MDLQKLEKASNDRADGFCSKDGKNATFIPENEIHREVRNSFKNGARWHEEETKELQESHDNLLIALENASEYLRNNNLYHQAQLLIQSAKKLKK